MHCEQTLNNLFNSTHLIFYAEIRTKHFTLLTNAEDTQALAKLTPNNLETQIAVLTAKYQIEAANTSQTTENQSNDKNKSAILSEYEQLWLNKC